MGIVEQIQAAGQSLWYDNIQRKLLEDGTLAGMIERGEIRGVTSNPAIFMQAMTKSRDYDASLVPMAWAGWSAEEIFTQLAIEDIRAAADLFLPLYRESGGGDGFVSLEVSPYLANDTAETLAEAKRLWQQVDRPNLMIKIPATRAGIAAIRDAIAAGLNVNVTLIFSLARYAEVMDAYISGLEQRAAAGLPLGSIASVASFFVSRVDTKIDSRLQEIVRGEGPRAEEAARLLGQAAIANARLAYSAFQETFDAERFAVLRAQGARVQRPLWASTSTKNPEYRDVMYVEELIGPDTVNTLPPQTLDAFLDHGQVRPSLAENAAEAREALERLGEVGVSMDQVTQELEAEGVQAFSDAFTELLRAVDERRQAVAEALGPLQAGVAARIAQLDREQAARRLWEHDPALWTDDSDGQEEIRRRLGWLNAPVESQALLPELTEFARQARADGYTRALLLGMGGSSLAPEVLAQVYGSSDTGEQAGLELLVLDSTDPGQVRAAADFADGGQTLYIVSSKSGSTSEVNAFLAYFWARAQEQSGEQAGAHFVAITDPGTALESLARERGFRRVFLADPTVGGRNAALTAFGLAPAALLGLDAARLLRDAERMAQQCAAERPAGSNPGLALGALLGEAALQGRDKLTILADPPYAPFGAWLEQLIAESTGKQGTGIVPVDQEPAVEPEQYGDDRLFVYLKNGAGENPLAERAGALRQAGQPLVEFELADTYALGAEFYRWQFATAVASAVLGVNSFDQPNVQENKSRTEALIAAYRRSSNLQEGQPVWEGPGGRVYGWAFPGLEDAATLAEVVQAFTALAQPGDYIALNAYVPRAAETSGVLQALREQVLRRTGRATTLGFGPRFLHSTGQLHKGGKNNGLFVQITHLPDADEEIPGEGLTFGALLRAQALGDLEALLARDRRVIRIALAEAGLDELLAGAA